MILYSENRYEQAAFDAIEDCRIELQQQFPDAVAQIATAVADDSLFIKDEIKTRKYHQMRHYLARMIVYLQSVIRESEKRFEKPSDMADINLSGLNMSGTNFFQADFSGSDLRGSDLSRCNLGLAKFWKADLQDSNLSGADIRGANFNEAELVGANLNGIILGETDFEGSYMTRSQAEYLYQTSRSGFARYSLSRAHIVNEYMENSGRRRGRRRQFRR